MFAGIGYDAHRFKKNRKLILGGHLISKTNGLDGHSDADVLVHAIMDAILGAAGLSDIGHYFPNTNKKYKGASSIELLLEVNKILKKEKFTVNNVDSTLICEAPKISPYIKKMKENIAKALNLKVNKVGLKATTNEKMGFVGRKEGIAAIAIATIIAVNSKK
ncbi:MAG: 2-C-methyl-D-erythritol 2,4-cyclodiphosphate synthase [Endomicrobiales bacterium]|nr:2-C-methyl-D-erythritol 2,4-cyclodiphosphate synthase [Endomicrobiales bacterium]